MGPAHGRPRILIVKLSSIGDLFHALPAVGAIKDAMHCEIHWCVQEEYVELVRCFTDVDEVIPFPRRSFLRKMKRFITALRKHRYDYVLDMQGLMKSYIVTLLSDGGRKIGPSFAREGTGLLYREKARGPHGTRHAVDRIMDVLQNMNIQPREPFFRVRFPSVKVDGLRPRIAIAPCSRWATKNWSPESFIQAALLILKQMNVSFYIIGSPADSDVCRHVADGIGSCASDLAGRYAVPEAGGLIQGMDLLITNDSGPMHMAAACGVPVVAVFGPTNADSTGPSGKVHEVITADVPCRPCFSRSCARGDLVCLTEISPEQVAGSSIKLLSRTAKRN